MNDQHILPLSEFSLSVTFSKEEVVDLFCSYDMQTGNSPSEISNQRKTSLSYCLPASTVLTDKAE